MSAPTSLAERLAWAGELESLPAPWRERVARLVADVERLEAERPQGYRYIQRPECSVNDDVREAVNAALANARQKLGVPECKVVWIVKWSHALYDALTAPLWRAARNLEYVDFVGHDPVIRSDVPLAGLFRKDWPSTITLRGDIPPRAAARAAVHELTHLWQYAKDPTLDFCDIEVNEELEIMAEEAERILVPENV